MNVRQHALKSIRGGMPARFAVQEGQGGVLFLDENEFIPFSDLGYSSRLGYFRLSAFPNTPSELTNENQETIHQLLESDEQSGLLYVWRDADGDLHMLGELHEAADLYAALADLLLHEHCNPAPISEHSPAWGQNYDIGRAVQEAIAYGYGDNPISIASAIRAAAAAGRIHGASRDGGRWSIPPATLRAWIVRSMAEKRGRWRRDGND